MKAADWFSCFSIATLTVAILLNPPSANAQGTVNFQNIAIVGGVRIVDAPVRCIETGELLAGTDFRAALYAGAPGTLPSGLMMIGDYASFATGNGAGYFLGGTRTMDGSAQANGVLIVPGDQANLQVRVWRAADGNTWEDAFKAGRGYALSEIITITTGGAGLPPAPPALMIGLNSFTFSCIPEPTLVFPAGVLAVMFALVRVKMLR